MKKTIRSMKELALNLGVSKTTVSFVLNGQGNERGISRETQERIFEAARLSDFQPNQLGRNLSSGQTKIIGVMVPDLSDPFYARIFHRVSNLLYAKGYMVTGFSSDEDEGKEDQLIQLMVQHRVDGLILASCRQASGASLAHRCGHIPVVLFDRELEGVDFPSILVPNEESAFQLTEQLIQSGHQQIGLMYVSPWLSSIKQRIRGFRNAMAHYDLPQNFIWEGHVDVHQFDSQMPRILNRFFQGPDTPTAIVVLNNVLGGELVRYLGKSDQKQVRVACFDHLQWFDYAPVSIVSVQQPLDLIADESVNCMMQLLCGAQPPLKTYLPTKII